MTRLRYLPFPITAQGLVQLQCLRHRSSGARLDSCGASDVARPATLMVTASLQCADGNRATFRYVTTGAGGLPAVDQTKSITRLLFAPPAATACQRRPRRLHHVQCSSAGAFGSERWRRIVAAMPLATIVAMPIQLAASILSPNSSTL